RSRGWPDLRNDSSMPSYRASATPMSVKPSTATVAPSGMAATACATEASRTPHPDPPPQGGREKSPSSQHVPAADVDDLAGDVASLVRRQESDHGGNIGALPHPPERDLPPLLLAARARDTAPRLRAHAAR